MTELLLGIDIGTSGTKVAAIDYSGKIAGIGYSGYDIDTPYPQWAEHHPDVWWNATIEATRLALSEVSDSAFRITAIGLSGLMHSLVLLDKDGKPLRSSIIWPDQRCHEEVNYYNEVVGKEKLAQLTANPVATGFFGPSLMWVKKHEPEVYEKIAHAILPKDYVRFKLTGEIGTETTDACMTLLYDTMHKCWSNELLGYLGLDSDYLPKCGNPWELAGVLTKDAAEALGLEPGIPVAFGGSDQSMQAIGNGIYTDGVASVVIGTGGQVLAPINNPIYDPELRIHTSCHAMPDQWFLMGAMLSAGLCLKWFLTRTSNTPDYKTIDLRCANVPVGSEGLIFLPYLVGERTPHMDPFARGAFLGLSVRHTQAHMTRAVMEGVTMALSEGLDIIAGLKTDSFQIIASGGGAESGLWRQIMADIFNRPVAKASTSQQSCVGAAVMAAVAAGYFPNVSQACQSMLKPSQLLETPIRENVEKYRYMKNVFKSAYKANKDIFHQLCLNI